MKNTKKKKELWITAQEAAELMGVHYETMRNYCASGLIECIRIPPARGASPLRINKMSIPSFLQVKKKTSMTAKDKT